MTVDLPPQAAPEAHPAMDELRAFLQVLVQHNGSDLFLSTGSRPMVKVQGELRPLRETVLPPGQVKRLAGALMDAARRREFEANLESDFAVELAQLGRFRFNVFQQRGEVSLVARHVKARIPTLAELKMPAALQRLVMLKRGLVLVVGAAGCGKSTTLAAMLDYRNRTAPGHILTIEDPIEFLHPHHQCVVDQREVGLDTRSFEEALRHGLREAPDVIMIGEIRDELTMVQAMKYAETGHLCLATLHSSNANQAVDRMINFFPQAARKQALLDLSLNLQGIVAQRLLRGLHGRMVPASELMVHSAYIAELIQKGMIDEIKPAIGKSIDQGMHTFDQSLYDLYVQGEIGLQEALDHADSHTDLSLRIRMHAGVNPTSTAGLGLQR